MTPIRHLEWSEYSTLIQRLLKAIGQRGFAPDLIVALARGGLVPAVSLSHALGCRSLGVIDCRRTSSDRILSLPPAGLEVRGHYLPAGTFDRILVVDDIVGHGLTVLRAGEMLAERYRGASVFCVTLFNDLNLEKPDFFADPDRFFSAATIEDEKWVVFCWERRAADPGQDSGHAP